MKHPLPERIKELNREYGVPEATIWGAHIRALILQDPWWAIMLIDHILSQRDELLAELERYGAEPGQAG